MVYLQCSFDTLPGVLTCNMLTMRIMKLHDIMQPCAHLHCQCSQCQMTHSRSVPMHMVGLNLNEPLADAVCSPARRQNIACSACMGCVMPLHRAICGLCSPQASIAQEHAHW